jgi:asparagine synthase (glutamine-hydrolysing)
MCGIAGIVSPDASTYIELMTDLISHRGPDDHGFFNDQNIGLGHRRLSIQDLSENGHQPMISYDGNFIIIFNGEIYNHWEIRKELESKYKFISQTDTESILYGFIEYGKDILNKLNGIFAFSIFNKLTKELFIARDHFGVKPLYYYCDNSLFWFSSELKSILPLKFNKEIDLEAIENYLTYLYSPGEKTPFKKVLKLLPGHFLSLNINNFQNFTITKYYDIPFNNSRLNKNEEELIYELENLLTKAVERQLLSDVPVGFFLSGGLDSSCIVAIAKKLHPEKKFNCYTIKTDYGKDMEEGFSNDLFYARIVAKHLDVNLIEVESNVDVINGFDKMIYHLDEPQADPAPLNVMQICSKAREDGQIVLLGGTAGDDLFSGYRRHQALQIEKYLKIIPLFLRKIIKNKIDKIPYNKPISRRLKKLAANLDKSQLERLVGYFSWINNDDLKNILSKNNQNFNPRYDPLNILKESLKNIPKEQDRLNQMLYLEMKYFLVDHNLNYTDKMSMVTGVEVRVPFLDKELVEFSLQIPTNLKLKGVTTKYILKKVMEKYLPHEVIYRSKSGFGAPVRKWIIEDMDHMIQIYLSKRNIQKRNIFDFEKIQKLIDDNKEGTKDASYIIWSLLSIESWMQQFYDSNRN